VIHVACAIDHLYASAPSASPPSDSGLTLLIARRETTVSLMSWATHVVPQRQTMPVRPAQRLRKEGTGRYSMLATHVA